MPDIVLNTLYMLNSSKSLQLYEISVLLTLIVVVFTANKWEDWDS